MTAASLSRVWHAREEVRILGPEHLTAFLRLAEADPVVNVFALHRAHTTNLEPRWLGGEAWGRFVDGDLVAACHAASNLVPVQATEEDARVFAEYAAHRRLHVTTLLGPREPVRAMWDVLRSTWAKPRDERWDQPHLELSAPPRVAPDLAVRVTTPADLEAVHPACVSMYTEEVGVSPHVHGGPELYRARVQQLISKGWSFARIDAGRVVFKAEVGYATTRAAQVQGVWVDPEFRGRGLGTAGMAAVVNLIRQRIAPTVSLYVNAWNAPARAAYDRIGFQQTATFATVMW